MGEAAKDAKITVSQRIQDNMGLVGYIIKKHFPQLQGSNWEDVLSAGTVGLAKAANKYDESRGASFSTYAYTVIINEIRMYLYSESSMVTVPRSTLHRHNLVKKNVDDINHLSDEDLKYLKEMKMTELSLHQIECSLTTTSIDEVISNDKDGSSTTIQETIEDTSSNYSDIIDLELTLEKYRDTITNKHHRKLFDLIMKCYYEGYDFPSQRELGDILGVTQSYASRLLKDLRNDIRRYLGGDTV